MISVSNGSTKAVDSQLDPSLYVKAQEKDVNLFAFLSPFSTYVWILMIMAGVSVSIVMYLIARFV